MDVPRVLITGSRAWGHPEVILDALIEVRDSLGDFVLVSGSCPTGADRMAEVACTELGLEIEHHPAMWGTYGKQAGFVRNEEMVKLGATVCLAFIKDQSRGASHTVRLAQRAGIPTITYNV